jgi:glycosyltransferase involved in cell wall biosynthesis
MNSNYNLNTNPSITAIILAKNEASMIANCIETVRWCDEIIVIDDDSEDATSTIAENAGCRVITFKGADFSKKRELGLKKSKTDWIFYIDADERVSPRLYQEISVHLETNQASALQLRRENICYGSKYDFGGWQSDYVTRIFKRLDLKGWQGAIHESAVYDGEITTLHTPLTHLTHRSTQENLLKSASWTLLEAELLTENNASKVTFFTLIRKGVMEFLKRAYFAKGYRDGMVGMIEAVVQAINRVLVYIQVWELQQKPSIPEKYEKIERDMSLQWKQYHQSLKKS